MEINPAQLPHRDVYKLLTGAVVPRPIAWVSTLSADGIPNLAPFSFFTVACSKPPTVVFSPSVRETDSGEKDTLRNIRETGEFVINFVSEPLAEAMNQTAAEVLPEVNEFERAGLRTSPARIVRPPYVADSPIHFECRLNQILTISDQPGGGSLVIGTVVHMHFDDRVLREGHHIDLNAYQAVGRLSGAGYTRLSDRFNIQRPPSEIPARRD